ncbi:MAG: hypothetical protein ACRYG7_35640 [Janthinobacterium lividum]
MMPSAVRKVLGFLAVVLCLSACATPPEHRVDISLASKLIHNNQLATFSFGNEGPPAWDSILVLKPYCNMDEVERFGIENPLAITRVVRNQSYGDFDCTLLFLREKSCVGYSVVSRQIVDLAKLANHKNCNLALITRTNCVKKLHRDKTYGGVSMLD